MNTFKSGFYVIGDPCLCLKNNFVEKYELFDETGESIFSGILDVEKNEKLAMFEIYREDCMLKDNCGKKYVIISSSLGIFPYEMCVENQGHIYSFDKDFQVEFYDGVFKVFSENLVVEIVTF